MPFSAILNVMTRSASIGPGPSAPLLTASLVLAWLALSSPVWAQQPGQRDGAPRTPGSGRGENAQPQPPPATLPTLYERLRKAESPTEAQSVVRQIARRWGRSGSETSDLLMARARAAMAQRNAPLAVEILDRIIALQPNWPEAWHVRGLAFFIMQDDARALFDFRETLRLEPNHFMALGLAAATLQRQGDQRGALRAFRAVQEMNPHFEGVKDAIERLVPAVEGRDA